MNKKSWTLLEAQQVLVDADQSDYSKPAKEMFAPLEKGHKAKLIFSAQGNEDVYAVTEQLWVEILMVDKDKFFGQLEDNPKHIQKLKRGKMIEFEERHMLDTD